MLNHDAIFDGSRFWSEEMRAMRAKAYGVETSQLPDYYRNRTLLKTEVTAEDVAEAALFLAGPRSSKTTGVMLPVDGGVKEAFPRYLMDVAEGAKHLLALARRLLAARPRLRKSHAR